MERTGALLRCLVHKVARPLWPAGVVQQAAEALMPAGSRSGRGTESLVPYLDHARSTRPAPLD